MFNPRADIERRAVDRLAALPFDKETGQTSRSAYGNRLGHELECIREAGLESRVEVAIELVDYADSKGILVGPGRRAAPSSLVLYLLGVTGIDPVANGLVFERWLSEPGIELDVEWERRDELLEYLRERYGDEVDGISVLGMKPLSALSEARKSLEFGKPSARFWHRTGMEADETTMKLFRSGTTDGVFQFSAEAMQHALADAKSRDFQDLVTLNGAFRPAFLTNGVFEEVVRRMAARDEVVSETVGRVFPEDRLREIGAVNDVLAETFGLMLFQEQFIGIVHRLSAWSYRESEQYRGQVKNGFQAELGELLDRATEAASVSERYNDDLRTLISHSRNTVLKSHVAAYALVGWMQAKNYLDS